MSGPEPSRSSSGEEPEETVSDVEELRGVDDETTGFNPLRSEGEAFRALLWVFGVFVVAVVLVLVIRAL